MFYVLTFDPLNILWKQTKDVILLDILFSQIALTGKNLVSGF